jgi:hypothetical protein
MLQFVKNTWLPTIVFIGLSGLFATIDRDKGVIRWAAVLVALTVPFIWNSFVIRQGRPRIGRAALTGSASGFMILTSDAMIWSVRQFLEYRRHAAEGIGGFLVILIPVAVLIGFLLGAGVGSLVAIVQSRWPGSPGEPKAADEVWNGKIGGLLIATIATPFVGFLAAILLPLDGRAPMNNLLTAMAGTWLVLAPAGTWLGLKALRRWMKALGDA